jgi:hypothetical protein
MKKTLQSLALFLLLAFSAGPSFAALWQWSLTPSSNGSADPTINWAVGMAPSAVDPSGRAMMARTAEWRDDISGSLATGGTSTAYTVTTNQSNGGNNICNGGAGPPINGQMIAITPNNTNGASPTLAVDTCTAAPIQAQTGIAPPVGTLVSGTPYNLKYSTANSAWMLANFFSGVASGIPLGALIDYTLSTAPNANFVLPAGQCISTTTYATYWVLLGSPAPGACGAGTFAIIDMRGVVAAGLDNLNGTAANRLTNVSTGCGTAMTSVGALCGNGSQATALVAANIPSVALSASGTAAGTVTSTVNNTQTIIGGTGTFVPGGGSTGNSINPSAAFTVSSTFSAGTASVTGSTTGGGSTTIPRVQPTVAVGKLLRVL